MSKLQLTDDMLASTEAIVYHIARQINGQSVELINNQKLSEILR